MRRSRWLVWLVALLGLLGLFATACGNDDDEPSATPDNAAEASAGPSGDPVKIGVLLTLSGPTAAVGETYKAGADFWSETVAKEGFMGRPVELIVRDDGGTPDQATKAARQLLDQDGVEFVVGPFSSGAAGGAVPLIAQAGKVQVLMSGFLEGRDAAKYPLVFPVEISAVQAAADNVQQAVALGYSKIAYFGPNNAFGQDVLKQMEMAAEENGDAEVVASQFYEPGSADVSAQMRQLSESDAEVLVFNDIAAAGYINGIKAIETLGWDIPIFGNSALAEPSIADAIGPEASQRAYVLGLTSDSLRPFTDDVAEFHTSFKEWLGEDSLDYRLAAPMTVFDSLELLRSTAEAVDSLEADIIAEELQSSGYDGLKANYTYGEDEHLGVEITELAPARVGTFQDGGLERAED